MELVRTGEALNSTCGQSGCKRNRLGVLPATGAVVQPSFFFRQCHPAAAGLGSHSSAAGNGFGRAGGRFSGARPRCLYPGPKTLGKGRAGRLRVVVAFIHRVVRLSGREFCLWAAAFDSRLRFRLLLQSVAVGGIVPIPAAVYAADHDGARPAHLPADTECHLATLAGAAARARACGDRAAAARSPPTSNAGIGSCIRGNGRDGRCPAAAARSGFGPVSVGGRCWPWQEIAWNFPRTVSG